MGSGIRSLVSLVSTGVLVAVGFIGTPRSASADWPHLRGPASESLPAGNLELALAWKIPIGSGYSGVVIEAERAVTAFADGEGNDVVAAFAVGSGAELWRARLDRTYEGHSGSQDGPVATPTLVDGRVVMVSPHGALVSWTLAEGRELWRRDLVAELGAEPPDYGIGATPLVVEDAVIVQTYVPGKGALHAFDLATGTLRWSAVDDTVGYQAPILAELSERRLIVAATDHFVVGVEPTSGAVLFQARHVDEAREGIGQPVIVRSADVEGVLVNAWEDPARFIRVRRHGEGWTTELAWETSAFGHTYAIAQQRADRLIGLKRSFLHVVDAASGETLWRSRQPGTSGLVLIGERLAVVDSRGDVVIGDVSGDAWRELAREPALDVGGLTMASYAAGHLFVRNLEHLAAVTVRGGTVGETTPPGTADVAKPALEGELLPTLAARLDAAEPAARGAILDAFLAGRELPLVETVGDRVWGHFLWRGEARDVALASAIFPLGQEPMTRLGETDLWFRSVALPAGGVWQYRVAVDLEQPQPDPRNGRVVRTPGGPSSWFATPGWRAPATLGPVAPEHWGQIETFTLVSEIRGNEREIRLLLPPRIGDGEYRLLVVTDADDTLREGFANVVDHLRSSGRIDEVVVAFVPFAGWDETGFRETEPFARMLAEELVPAVGTRVRLADGGHVLFGPGGGATGSLTAALRSPETFSRVALLDLQSWDESEDLLRALIAEERTSWPAVRCEWSTTGQQSLRLGRSSLQDRAWLPEALEQAGAAVTSVDFPGGPGYASWRGRFEAVLLWLVGPGP